MITSHVVVDIGGAVVGGGTEVDESDDGTCPEIVVVAVTVVAVTLIVVVTATGAEVVTTVTVSALSSGPATGTADVDVVGSGSLVSTVVPPHAPQSAMTIRARPTPMLCFCT